MPTKQQLRSEPYVSGTHIDVRYKVVLIGDSMVGKSSVLRCWRGDRFEPSLLATVGLDFSSRVYDLSDGRLRLDVWDTAGQERYGTITRVHYRDAKGLIFVYDIGVRESFERLRRHWLGNVDENLSEAVPIFIVGNKLDLADGGRREVSTAEGQRFADAQSASGFFETSAKDGREVLELFYSVASTMADMWGLEKLTASAQERMNSVKKTNDKNDPIQLGERSARITGENNCCRH